MHTRKEKGFFSIHNVTSRNDVTGESGGSVKISELLSAVL